MSDVVLVIAAHPDDEVLGCGGAIAKHIARGDDVHVVILAEGITSREKCRDRSAHEDELSELAKSARQAHDVLGVKHLTLHDLPDNRMDGMELLDIVKIVEGYVSGLRPRIVYTHWIGDVNVDHGVIHRAVVTACRSMPGSTVERILYFEVASSTEWQTPGSAPAFVPQWYIDITSELALKLKALGAYASEMRDWPHSRSLKAVEYLAHLRGANIGCDAAEAFVLGRNIER